MEGSTVMLLHKGREPPCIVVRLLGEVEGPLTEAGSSLGGALRHYQPLLGPPLTKEIHSLHALVTCMHIGTIIHFSPLQIAEEAHEASCNHSRHLHPEQLSNNGMIRSFDELEIRLNGFYLA